MTTEIALRGQPEPHQAKHVSFQGFNLIAVCYGGSFQRICLASIEQALPGITETPEWQRFIGSQEVIWIRLDQGKPFRARVIPKADFFNAALSHPKYPRFRAFAAQMLAQLDDTGLVVSPEFSDDLRVQSVQRLLEMTMLAVRAEKTAQEALSLATQANTRANDAHNLAETAIDVMIRRDGRLFGVENLLNRGWDIPQDDYNNVGKQLSKLSRERLRDEPADFKQQSGARRINTYLPLVFDIWEKEYGRKYKRILKLQ